MHAEVFTRDPCPHCVSAKKLLESKGISYTEIAVTDETKPMLVERVMTATGKPPMTVPQIFLEGEYIGGADALRAYFKAL